MALSCINMWDVYSVQNLEPLHEILGLYVSWVRPTWAIRLTFHTDNLTKTLFLVQFTKNMYKMSDLLQYLHFGKTESDSVRTKSVRSFKVLLFLYVIWRSSFCFLLFFFVVKTILRFFICARTWTQHSFIKMYSL